MPVPIPACSTLITLMLKGKSDIFSQDSDGHVHFRKSSKAPNSDLDHFKWDRSVTPQTRLFSRDGDDLVANPLLHRNAVVFDEHVVDLAPHFAHFRLQSALAKSLRAFVVPAN